MRKRRNEKSKLNIIHALIAAFVVLLMFIGISVISKITPFGDKTFLMYDMKRQYVDFDMHLRSILRGENNVFYSFSTALGSGTLGFVTYYLASPFLLLLVFCPQSYLPVGISIIVCLKLMSAAFIMDLFLQRTVLDERIVFDNPLVDKKSLGILVCSLSWALSGYLFAHSMNMMWMDVVIMLPLLIWALENLLEYDRKVPYIACLTVMLLINYYITYQVLLFTALWTLMKIIVCAYKDPVKKIFRVILSTLLAPCIGAVTLIPTALELMNSPKDITQLGLELTGNNLLIRDVLSKLPTLAYDYIEARFGLPQLFCGVLLILLTMLYFTDNKRPLKERVGIFVLFCIFLVSFCKDILNLIWHAGMEPSGHPYRQAFMWVFMMILCSAYAITDLEEILNLPRLLTVTGLTALMFFEVIRKRYDHVSVYTLYANVALLTIYGIMLLCFILFKDKKKTLARYLFVAIVLIDLLDIGANASYTYYYQALKCENLSVYHDVVSKTKEAVDKVKEADGSFYRMENLNPRQQNDSMQYGYNGITHYSSAGMTYVRYFLQRLGFNDDTLYTHYGHDNTATVDSLLGVRYILTDGVNEAKDIYEPIYDGDVKVFKNPYALPVAIGTKGFDLNGISGGFREVISSSMEHVPKLDPFSLQEDIYGRLSNSSVKIFEKASVESTDIFEEDEKYNIDHTVRPVISGNLYFYLNGLIEDNEGLSIYVNDEFLTTYGNASCLKILNLGYVEKGDEIKVRVQAENKDDNFGQAFFVTENTKSLKEAYEKTAANGCEVKKISSSHLNVATGECDGVFMTIPCEKGWKIKVDGIKTEPVAIYDSLTYIPIDGAGETHDIDMFFVPDGLYIGILISLAAIGIFIWIILGQKKKAGGSDEQ
ncbi:MAG: YfhO family protein [Lachnospiraceae bacterium]|nr:YfhO family protein [Lachnospiraceae bacterium]